MPTSARSQASDLFYSNRFALVFESGPSNVAPPDRIASFQSIAMPEHSIESMEYSEGTFTYSRHYPGRSSFSTVSCSRGYVKNDNFLARWIRRAAEGWNYRVDLSIQQFHRSDVVGLASYRGAKPTRVIKMINCVPVRFKPGSDFDAMSSELSIQEIEFSMERFVVFESDSEVRPGG